MGEGKSLSFEDLVRGREPAVGEEKVQETMSEAEAAAAYWKERSEGRTYPKYVELYGKRYDGTAFSMLETLTYMNVYMADKDSDDCFSEDSFFNETGFGYAEFYEWFSDEYLGNEDAAGLVSYNFNGELPPVLKFGEAVYNDLIAYRDAAEYDGMPKNEDPKKSGDRLLEYVRRMTSDMSILAFMDAENMTFVSAQVALYRDMPEDVKAHMERIVKTNILQLADDGGYAAFIYYKDDGLRINGFRSEGGRIVPMSEDEFEAFVPKFTEYAQDQNNCGELLQAFGMGVVEVPADF